MAKPDDSWPDTAHVRSLRDYVASVGAWREARERTKRRERRMLYGMYFCFTASLVGIACMFGPYMGAVAERVWSMLTRLAG